ncbi:tax1-binding protein 3 [Poeciliopsis prolifica]|uniref:tax1-binding protein 3 n=1 Tax=Poeciliopsis prolifica TaxID=188132 RepID=UPI00072D565F|nr:tax1-binding protein 3 [Poeciliopsis prolifica]
MSFVPGQPVTAVVQRIEIQKLRQGDNLILGFSIGGGIDQDPGQNPFSEDKSDKGIYVTRITPGGPAEVADLRIGDKIMQVNGWDMTMVTHDQARKKLTKKREDVVRLLITRKSLEEAVKHSKGSHPSKGPSCCINATDISKCSCPVACKATSMQRKQTH